MNKGRVVVVSACTGRKITVAPGGTVEAGQLYAGDHHARLLRGVEALKCARTAGASVPDLDMWIVSAKYGLVPGERQVEPYDRGFAGMGRRDLDEAAERLNIAGEVSKLLGQPWDLALVLLGNDYLRAAQVQKLVAVGGPTLVFCSRSAALSLPASELVRPVPVGVDETRRFACGLVGLKRETGGRLLSRVAADPEGIERLSDPGCDVLEWLDSHKQPTLAAAV